jgi:hypothetical protein
VIYDYLSIVVLHFGNGTLKSLLLQIMFSVNVIYLVLIITMCS